MSVRKLDVRLALLLGMLAAAACSGENGAAPVNTPPPGALRVDESKTGTLAGRVLFEGTAPDRPAISVGSDPVCAREHPGGITFENVVVTNGGLDNVFVYVKDGLGNYYFDTPASPATLDQQGCRYVPHVMGVRVGQPIEIANSDGTMHNVNAQAKANRGFNFPQPIKGMKEKKTFSAREVMVLFKCDVHPWMNAYVGVLEHPYFAVSANGGGFELKNVPAGTYTVEAWHEKLGTETQSVTIGEQESKTVTFTFKS
jgi:plastocyanin